ncbi:MAG: carbohydrate ABC transporter permease [Defluviitaleaceae bacterium]|nr:carbohydrate ABC transporter permease [Defluviitaleaceae bacterium]
MSHAAKRRIGTAFRYTFLSAVSLLSIFPLYWMAVASTNRTVDILRGTLIPGTEFLNNLRFLLEGQNITGAMRNSFVNAASTTLAALVICSLAGYGFEVYHTKNNDRMKIVLLTAMMIPFATTMIPLFRMFAQMGLLNATLAVILPSISTPFLIMLFRQSTRSFPHDIIEAARLDGLNEISIFFRMFIPTMRPTYAAAMTITFMGAWNNFLWPRVIIMNNEMMTMPMLVANLTAGYVTNYGVLMLAVLLSTIPTVIVFFLLQKSFAEGITGAVKG